jgi:ABC-2 type transport system ATP-binding protein
MDPISRRYVWDHITTIKRGRVVLLTTLAMEEADQLSDSVAVMCDGKLVASGSPLELKYRSAIQFSMIVGKQHTEKAIESIKRHFEVAEQWVDMKASDSGYLTLNIKSPKMRWRGRGGSVDLSSH